VTPINKRAKQVEAVAVARTNESAIPADEGGVLLPCWKSILGPEEKARKKFIPTPFMQNVWILASPFAVGHGLTTIPKD
jgi:hypothetical protein